MSPADTGHGFAGISTDLAEPGLTTALAHLKIGNILPSDEVREMKAQYNLRQLSTYFNKNVFGRCAQLSQQSDQMEQPRRAGIFIVELFSSFSIWLTRRGLDRKYYEPTRPGCFLDSSN